MILTPTHTWLFVHTNMRINCVAKSQHNLVSKAFHATKINVLLFVAGAHRFDMFYPMCCALFVTIVIVLFSLSFIFSLE